MNSTNCPICNCRAALLANPGDNLRLDCPRCGQFVVSRTAAVVLNGAKYNMFNKLVFSHKVRVAQRPDRLLEINTEHLKAWALERLPTPTELCANFLLWAASASPLPGSRAKGFTPGIRATIGAADDPDGLSYAEQAAQKEGYITRPGDADGMFVCQVTLDGWKEVERLQSQRSVSRHGFMAMQFGAADISNVYRNAFIPGAARAGFELRLVTDNQPAGLIDDQLRVAIRTARFVVADLTHENRGAYWEAGFAEGLGRPVFYTCEKSRFETKGTHFDTNHLNTVVWAVDNMKAAEDALAAMIRATLPEEAIMEDTH